MDAAALSLRLAADRAAFLRIARKHLPSEADAEDVVQRALLRATLRAASLTDAARARAWFGSILRRGIADFYRSQPPVAAREVLETDVVADAPELRGRPCACSRRLLGALRPALAEALRRVDLEGETPASAARALGVSVATLQVRLHRARHTLRARVQAHCGVSSCGPCLDCTCDDHHRCGRAGGAPGIAPKKEG